MGRGKRNGQKKCVYVCLDVYFLSTQQKQEFQSLWWCLAPTAQCSCRWCQTLLQVQGQKTQVISYVGFTGKQGKQSVLTSYISSPLCSSLHEVMKGILFSQHIDKVFKHKELQQQLVDAKLQQTTQLIKEADEKHQREREFVSSVP